MHYLSSTTEMSRTPDPGLYAIDRNKTPNEQRKLDLKYEDGGAVMARDRYGMPEMIQNGPDSSAYAPEGNMYTPKGASVSSTYMAMPSAGNFPEPKHLF